MKNRPLQQGITREEHTGAVKLTQGVPMESYWGDSKDEGLPATAGVPHVGQGKTRGLKRVCQGINKKGNPCGARPMKGENLCVGHMKQLNATK